MPTKTSASPALVASQEHVRAFVVSHAGDCKEARIAAFVELVGYTHLFKPLAQSSFAFLLLLRIVIRFINARLSLGTFFEERRCFRCAC